MLAATIDDSMQQLKGLSNNYRNIKKQK